MKRLTRKGSLVYHNFNLKMELFSLYIILVSCLQAVYGISEISYKCPLSDVYACGPMGICNCSYVEVECSSRGLKALPPTLPLEVKQMYFSSNYISCVPIKYFKMFTKLHILYLDNNQIRRSFYLPNSLTTIYIRGNQLLDIDNFFVHGDNLQFVHFGHNNLTIIPDNIFQTCSRLTLLALQENPIEAIPPTLFRNCTRLESLYLKSCEITSLSSDIFLGLPLLELDISRNKMEIQENLFPNLEGFYELKMSSMKLKTLPGKLFETTSIHAILDIGSNELKNIPPKLFSMNQRGHRMTSLLLGGNQLTSIPRELFNNLTNLRYLYLHGNNLKTLPGNILAGTDVVVLYLFQNQIGTLAEPLRGDNRSTLKQVFIQDNPISHLSSDVLNEMADGGLMNLSCDSLMLPTIPRQINVTCMPPSAPLVMNVSLYAAQVFRYRGFNCTNTEVVALMECKSCVAGTFGGRSRVPLGVCESCPKGGFYQDRVGQYSLDGVSINCKTCNPGTFVKEGGGDSPLSCEVCPTGTNKSLHAGFRACLCLEDYYRRDRFGECDLCSQEGAMCKNDYMTMRPGYYWNWSSPLTNLDEYIKFVENLQTFNESYDFNSTSFKGSLAKIHKCLKVDRCTNHNDSIAGNCAEGYTGWMCSACSKKHFPIFGFCRPCPDLSLFVAELVLILIVVLAAFCLFVFSYRRQDSHNRSLVDSTLALGKIVLGFYQVIGEFWESIDVAFWPQFLKDIASWLKAFQLNLSSILIKPSCFFPALILTPYTAFILGSLFPYFAIVCTLFVIALIKIHSRISARRDPLNLDHFNTRLRRYQSNIFAILVLILFVTYTSTCNVTFALYSPTCNEYSLDEYNAHNISLLRSDYSIDCNTDTHRRYEIASYFATTYVIGFPTVLYILLRKHSKKVVFGELNQDELRQADFPKWLRFLNENYKVDFWFWEIVEMIRKVSQTFVIVLFGWHSYFAIVITLTLAVVFLSLHISFRPMKDNFEHYLQLTSLWAIFCNMLIAAVPVPVNFSRSFSAEIVIIILIIINISVIGIAAMVTFLKMVSIVCRTDCNRRVVPLRLNTRRQVDGDVDTDGEESLLLPN